MKLLGLVLVAAALSGCGGGGATAAPTSLPPVTAEGMPGTTATSSAPTPLASATDGTDPPLSPSAKALAEPTQAGAQAYTSGGAEVFALEWVSAFNRARKTRDPGEISALSAATCATCQAYIGSLARARAAGNTYRGGDVVVRTVVASPVEDDTSAVLVNYDAPSVEVLDRGGAVIRVLEAQTNATFDFTLRWTGDNWTAENW